MAVLVEPRHTGEYLVSEPNGDRGRETGKLASGNNLVAGAILGKITSASDATADGGNTGDGTASAPALGTEAINGTYVLTCTAAVANAGVFSVATPGGALLADLTVAVAYVSSHINLTISDGAADFIVGDIFTIDVIIGEYGEFDPGASDGTETAVAVLYSGVDASAAEQKCVVTKRDTEIDGGALTWIAGITEVQKVTATASLSNSGIIVR